jgi:catechol 2,3-dioxygenase-like lactoylglutathione lyase family enzyme
MGSKSSQFEMLGYHHIALVCRDMQDTVDFYEGVLGFPLVKTLEYAGGRGQHFFFQVTEDDGVAFFWWNEAPGPQPGLTGAPWKFEDENGNPVPGIAGVAAKDAMHHLAFDVPLEKIDEYRERLIAAGVEVHDVQRHTGDGQGNDTDECIRSLYFRDPDGILLEFAAMTRPFDERDLRHEPASAADAAARLQPGKVPVTV